jgi:hypothetical protein
MIFCYPNVLEQGKKTQALLWAADCVDLLECCEHHPLWAGACVDYLAFELDPFFWIQIYFTSLFFII